MEINTETGIKALVSAGGLGGILTVFWHFIKRHLSLEKDAAFKEIESRVTRLEDRRASDDSRHDSLKEDFKRIETKLDDVIKFLMERK